MHLVKAAPTDIPTDVCPTFSGDTLVADDGGGATLSFPGLCVADNGDFVVAYRHGASHTSSDGVVKVIISSDQGATWSAATTVLTSGSWDYRDSSLTCLRDGTIILSQSRRTSAPAASTSGCVFLISTDHGQTWGSPIVVATSFTGWVYGGAPIVEQPDGTLLTTIYGADSGDPRTSVRLLTSTDGGASWSNGATVADGPTDGLDYNESGIVRAPEGLVCLIRRANNDFRRTVSTDDGATWSTPATVLASASAWPKPIRLPDGRMLVAYRATSASNRGRVAVSFNDGATWSTCTDLVTGGDKFAYSQFDVDDAGGLWLLYSHEHASGDDGRLYLRSATVPQVQAHTHTVFDIVDLDTATSTPAPAATGITIEAATVDGTTGAVSFRWGIDGSGRPYFDSAGTVTEAEAAQLLLDTDGRFYVEDLPL